MLNFKNKILTKIISLTLIQAFLFAGILYPDSINSSNNKDIASIYEPYLKLRVPMMFGKTKGSKPGSGTLSRVANIIISLTSAIGANAQAPAAQTLTPDSLFPPGITIVNTRTQQLEENFPTIEEQSRILENFCDTQHPFLADYVADWERLIDEYGSENVFYSLKIGIDKKIISKDIIYCICSDLRNVRKGDKTIDAFLAFIANKGYVAAYYALYDRLGEDFIKAPDIVITKKFVSSLVGMMPSRSASSILRIIFSNPDNLNLIDSGISRKFLLNMSIKTLNPKTIINLMRGNKMNIDDGQMEQLKQVAFLLASWHLIVSDRPSIIPEILKNGAAGIYDGAGNAMSWQGTTPNMLEIYLYPEKNILPRSKYRPTNINVSEEPQVYYNIEKWSEVTSISDTAAWPSDFLKKLSEMKKGEILYFNKKKYYLVKSPQFKTGISLGNFLQSFGRDNQGVYMSIRDIWDFRANGGFFKEIGGMLFEAQLMQLVGTPIPIYVRYYLNIEKELERRGESSMSISNLRGAREAI